MQSTGPTRASAFAIIKDETETTVIIEESKTKTLDADAVEAGWKRLTFEIELPFELVGFLGIVATEFANADVSVFVLSSYSTDHVFVKEANLDDALSPLEDLGCTILNHNDSQ